MRLVQSLIFILTINYNAGNEVTPPEYFGTSWDEAIRFCQRWGGRLNSCFTSHRLDPGVGMAIAFPELVRYNRLRDILETSALELLYVQKGSSVVDFSIGPMQMKPSFVEMLEQELQQADATLQHEYKSITTYDGAKDEWAVRKARLQRLKRIDWQMEYLACFLRLASNRFSTDTIGDAQKRLTILSSAYNLSLRASLAEIEAVACSKTFPYGRWAPGRFSYADISLYFFNNLAKKILTQTHTAYVEQTTKSAPCGTTPGHGSPCILQKRYLAAPTTYPRP